MTESRYADEGTLAHIAQLEALVTQQAAVIEQKNDALRAYAEWTQVSRTGESPTITYSNDAYKALALQPCPEVLKEHDQMVIASFLEREGKWTVNDAILNKVRADAVREFVKPYSDSHTYIGIAIKKEAELVAQRIERGEA